MPWLPVVTSSDPATSPPARIVEEFEIDIEALLDRVDQPWTAVTGPEPALIGWRGSRRRMRENSGVTPRLSV